MERKMKSAPAQRIMEQDATPEANANVITLLDTIHRHNAARLLTSMIQRP